MVTARVARRDYTHALTSGSRNRAMDAFEQAFAFVIGHEGGYSAGPTDPGNWTGGRCGLGECRGTNWGISAAAYPQLDIRALTQAQAAEIYRRDYWDRPGCGRL